jgi:predicted GNAT family N-acyltransferase
MQQDIEILKFRKKDNSLYNKALEIRKLVFVKEQGVPESEELENEDEAVYFLLLVNGIAACTARYRIIGNKIKLERFATLKNFRKQGLATKLLRFILNDLKNARGEIYLHSQAYITSLYEKEGFVKKGDIFYEAGIPHYLMVFEK